MLNTPVVIQARGGNDTISAGAGTTAIYTGRGNDSIAAGSGVNLINCGTGNDTVTGAANGDVIHGNGSAATVNGQAVTTPMVVGQASTQAVAIGNSSGGSSSSGGASNPNSSVLSGSSSTAGSTSTAGTSSSTGTSSTTGSSSTGGITTTTGTVSTTGSSTVSGMTAAITLTTGQNIIAGEAVHVQGLTSVLASGTPLNARYVWDFGDPHSQYDELEGFNAAHLYANPGTYIVTLTVTNDLGQKATATATINVALDTRPVIYVAANGNDNNNGLSPSSPIQSVARAGQLVSDNTVILFRSGDVFDMTQSLNLGSHHDVTVGAYGTGANPELYWTGARDGGAMVQTQAGAYNVVIRGLTFDTIFNQDMLQDATPMAIVPAGTNIAIVGNTFLNVDYAVNANTSPTGLLVQDNAAPSEYGLRGYFVWIQGSDIVIIGNTVANSTQEDVLRGEGTRILIEYNNLTNIQFGADGTAKSAIAIQQGTYAYVAYNTINQGGNVDFGPVSNNSAAAEADAAGSIDWVVVAGNTIDSYLDVQAGTAHIRVENNLFQNDDIALINVDAYIPSYNRIVSDLQIVNNTAIDAGQWGEFIKLYGQANGLVVDNNVFDAPNIQYGWYDASDIYIAQNDLSSFDQIDDNVWPTSGTSWSTGGVFYVSAETDNKQAYLSLVSLQNLGFGAGDTEQNVTFTQTYTVTTNGVMAGSMLPVSNS
jgi:PKD repeat protein